MAKTPAYYTCKEVKKMFDLDDTQLELLIADDENWKKIRRRRESGELVFDKTDVDNFKEKIFTEPTMNLEIDEEEDL